MRRAGDAAAAMQLLTQDPGPAGVVGIKVAFK
jgi:hypothetical protein